MPTDTTKGGIMAEFNHSIMQVAVWNLAGFTLPGKPVGISARSKKAERQA